MIVNTLVRLTEIEAEEWKAFSDKLADFKALGAQVHLTLVMMSLETPMMQVMGVCTDSHVLDVTVRAMLMISLKVSILTILKPYMIILSLKGIKFPIICDRDGDFSRAFGVLKISYDKMKNSSERKFGAARAVFFCFFRIVFLISVSGGGARP